MEDKPGQPNSKMTEKEDTAKMGKGLILFPGTSEAIWAEKILKKAGYEIKMVAPPYHLRKGCDLAVEFPLIEQLGIERSLKGSGNPPLEILPISKGTLEPIKICKQKDFGRWLMIRAANMKLTFDRETGRIVNISGGGCPDVPYLASEMMEKKLDEAPSPKEIGHTVCAYALNVAFEKGKNIMEE